MSKHFTTAEHLSVLSDEQLDQLEQEILRQQQEESGGTTEPGGDVKRLIGKGIIRGAAAFGEGALLGFQGRPLSEGTFTGDPKTKTDTYGDLLKREQLKNIVDPSRIKAQHDIEEDKRKEEVLKRKLREQNEIPEPSAITPTPQTGEVGQSQPPVTQAGTAIKGRPPKRIKIGEDENGLAIFGDNPDYADALKQEGEIRSQEFAIQKEERSIDLIAKKAAEKDRQLNISKISRLTNLVDLIETEFAKTKTPSGAFGLIRRPVETFTRGFQLTENQRQDKAYGEFIGGLKVQLARAMSEVGNLSEPEQKAALDLVPDLLTDPRTATIKLKQLRDLVSKVRAEPGDGSGGSATNTPTPEEISKAKAAGFTHYNTETGEWLK